MEIAGYQRSNLAGSYKHLVAYGEYRNIQYIGSLFIAHPIFFYQLKNHPALRGQFPDTLFDGLQHFCADTQIFRIAKAQYRLKIHLFYMDNGVIKMPGYIV